MTVQVLKPKEAVFVISVGGMPIIDKSDFQQFVDILYSQGIIKDSVISAVPDKYLCAKTHAFGIFDFDLNRTHYFNWLVDWSYPKPYSATYFGETLIKPIPELVKSYTPKPLLFD